MIGFALAFALGQRKPVTLTPPVVVNTAPVAVAEGSVVMANSLPNASSGGAAGGAAAGAPGTGGQRGPGSGGRAMGAGSVGGK